MCFSEKTVIHITLLFPSYFRRILQFMKYLYFFINLLFNNHLKLLQTNSFCCKLIAGLLCWSIQDKTCSKSRHFTSYCWYDANVTPQKQVCRWGLAHDDMPSAWWRDGEEVWPYAVNSSWTHFDVGRGWLGNVTTQRQ